MSAEDDARLGHQEQQKILPLFGGAYDDPALGAPARFDRSAKRVSKPQSGTKTVADVSNSDRIPRPGLLWRARTEDRLPANGGRKRPIKPRQRRAVSQFEI